MAKEKMVGEVGRFNARVIEQRDIKGKWTISTVVADGVESRELDVFEKDYNTKREGACVVIITISRKGELRAEFA